MGTEAKPPVSAMDQEIYDRAQLDRLVKALIDCGLMPVSGPDTFDALELADYLKQHRKSTSGV